jgi:energy-coupling factor transporter ATP-binding protein EcfA2
VVGIAHQLSTPGARLTTRLLSPRQAAARIARATTPLGAPPAHLNARELVSVIGWPIGDPLVPGLRLGGSRPLPPVAELPQTGRVVGTATYPGLERPVAISPADSLMHTLITGPTGSGKSTLLLNMLVQDVAAGRGVVLLDPNGDLARDVLDRVPESRLDDVVHIDPADVARPVPLNPLAASPDDAELVADQLLQIIRQRATNWGPRLEEILANSLTALAASGGTLAELRPLLEDEGYRRALVARLDPALVPGAAAFFKRFEQWSEDQRHEAIAAVLNKVSPLTGRRMLRNMVGQSEPSWSMAAVLATNKIMLASLPSGLIGPYAAEVLGATILSLLWNAVLGRAAVGRELRQPSFVYVDESPRFVGGADDLSDALARARGHGTGLILATQHLDQFPAGLRRTVLSEARSKISFQPGADDANTLARHFGPLVTATDLQALPARTAMAALVVGGRVAAPVTIATAPPPPPTGLGQLARDASRRTYGRDRDEVERAIQARRRPPESGPRRTRRVP